MVLSPGEVMHFLDSIHNTKQRAILTIAYAAGLRVSEVTHLKVTDIDSQRMVLRVDQGKGNKDRYVMLSPRLLDELRAYWKTARPATWLFPGDIDQTPDPALAAPRLCHPLARSRHGHTHHPTPAGAPQSGHDIALPQDRHQHRVCNHESSGLATPTIGSDHAH
jgi:integrase